MQTQYQQKREEAREKRRVERKLGAWSRVVSKRKESGSTEGGQVNITAHAGWPV
jgi:hypothetical protein